MGTVDICTCNEQLQRIGASQLKAKNVQPANQRMNYLGQQLSPERAQNIEYHIGSFKQKNQLQAIARSLIRQRRTFRDPFFEGSMLNRKRLSNFKFQQLKKGTKILAQKFHIFHTVTRMLELFAPELLKTVYPIKLNALGLQACVLPGIGFNKFFIFDDFIANDQIDKLIYNNSQLAIMPALIYKSWQKATQTTEIKLALIFQEITGWSVSSLNLSEIIQEVEGLFDRQYRFFLKPKITNKLSIPNQFFIVKGFQSAKNFLLGERVCILQSSTPFQARGKIHQGSSCFSFFSNSNMHNSKTSYFTIKQLYNNFQPVIIARQFQITPQTHTLLRSRAQVYFTYSKGPGQSQLRIAQQYYQYFHRFYQYIPVHVTKINTETLQFSQNVMIPFTSQNYVTLFSSVESRSQEVKFLFRLRYQLPQGCNLILRNLCQRNVDIHFIDQQQGFRNLKQALLSRIQNYKFNKSNVIYHNYCQIGSYSVFYFKNVSKGSITLKLKLIKPKNIKLISCKSQTVQEELITYLQIDSGQLDVVVGECSSGIGKNPQFEQYVLNF